MFTPSESECMDTIMRALKDTQQKVDELETLLEFYRSGEHPAWTDMKRMHERAKSEGLE